MGSGRARITMDIGCTPITLCGIAQILPLRHRQWMLTLRQRKWMLTSLRHGKWEFWPSPEYYTATAYGGCQEDGLDCRYSRCCARQGSRCFVKDDRWASCNESCFSFTQWEGHHRHGHWKRTNFPVWDCTDITEEA